MSDKFIRYGDRTREMEPGMTLDQAKDLMTRHFPELADPKVEIKKQGEKTIYVFSKKAGHKGARLSPQDRVIQKLARARETPVVPEAACQAVTGDLALEQALEQEYDPYGSYAEDPLIAVVRGLREDAVAVGAAATGLLDLPTAQVPTGSVL